MIKHSYLKNCKLNVSKDLHHSKALELDEDGIIQEELTKEQETAILAHTDFKNIKEEDDDPAGSPTGTDGERPETASQKRARLRAEKAEAEAKAKAALENKEPEEEE